MAKALGHTPDRLTFYDATHKRKDGTYVDQSTKHYMDAAFSLQAERSLNSSASTNEIAEQVFEEIFGKEHNGRVRGLGLGPTPTSYFGSASYDVGRRWNSSSQSHDSASLKAELKDLSTRHEELCGKYEDLASKHEIVSNKYAVMDAFLSQKFPGEWMPNSQETDNRVRVCALHLVLYHHEELNCRFPILVLEEDRLHFIMPQPITRQIHSMISTLVDVAG